MPMTMIKLLQYYINTEVRVLGNICINDKKNPDLQGVAYKWSCVLSNTPSQANLCSKPISKILRKSA